MSIPTEGHTLPEAYDNHLVHAQRIGAWEERQKWEKKDPRFEIYWYTTGRLLTQMAREKLVEVALIGGMDFIIMYDDDMVLPPDFAIRMLEDMVAHPEIDVLGALAFMRNAPYYPVIYTVTDGYDPKTHQPYYFREFVKRYPKDTLVECDAVGFGGVCIRTSLLKRMKAPYFMSTTGTGEDIWFCYQAKKTVQARIFMDTRIKMGHLKNPEIVDEDYFDAYAKKNKLDLGEEMLTKYLAQDK